MAAPSQEAGVALVVQRGIVYGDISAMALSSGADAVAIGTEDGTIGVWDVERRLKVLDYHTHEGKILAIAFVDDEQLVFVKTGQLCRVAARQDANAVACRELVGMTTHSGAVLSRSGDRVAYQVNADRKRDREHGRNPWVVVPSTGGDATPISETERDALGAHADVLREDERAALQARVEYAIRGSIVDRDVGIAVFISDIPHVVELNDLSRSIRPLAPRINTADYGPMWGYWTGETSIAIGTIDSIWQLDLTDLSMRRLGASGGRPFGETEWSAMHACPESTAMRVGIESSQARHRYCRQDGALLDTDGRTIVPSRSGDAKLSPNGRYLLVSVSNDSRRDPGRSEIEVWEIGRGRLWSRSVRARPQLILNDGRVVVWRAPPSNPGGPGFLGIRGAVEKRRSSRLELEVLGVDGRLEKRLAIEERRNPGSMTSSPDGKYLFIGAQGFAALELRHYITQVSIDSGEIVARFDGPRTSSSIVDVSPDGRWLLANGFSGELFVWNVQTGKRLTITTANPEWVIFDDDGRFTASRRGDELLAAVATARAFPIRTAAVALNRPDLLLAEMGLDDVPAVARYREAFQVRLRKLGLDQARLSAAFSDAPLASIDLIGEPHGRVARVKVGAHTPSGAELDGYTLLVNGVPVGGGGIRADTPIETEVVLEHGENRISAFVRDAAGLESIPDSKLVHIDDPPAHRTLHLVGVGTSRFVDSRLDLAYAAKDVRDLDDALSRLVGKGAMRRRILTDHEVTREGLAKLAVFVAQAAVDDIVLMVVAGHGVHAEQDGRYYYLPHEVNVEDVPATGWSFEELEALLAGTPARNRLLLLDTCESGEREGTTVGSNVPGAKPRTSRALVFEASPTVSAAAVVDRESYLYNDILTRNGAIVLSSSTGSELSYELDELQNGAFTEAVLEALAGAGDTDGDGALDSEELRRYVERRVPELTQGAQHPRVDRENRERTIVLPLRGSSAATATESESPRTRSTAQSP